MSELTFKVVTIDNEDVAKMEIVGEDWDVRLPVELLPDSYKVYPDDKFSVTIKPFIEKEEEHEVGGFKKNKKSPKIKQLN